MQAVFCRPTKAGKETRPESKRTHFNEFKSMQSYIVYRKAMALTLTLIILLCISMILFSLYYLKSTTLAFIFFIGVVLPLLFIDWVIKMFTRKIIINLNEVSFSIITIKNNGQEERNETYLLEEISTYNIQFPTRKFSAITFNLREGKAREYCFFKEKKIAEQTNTTDLLGFFHKMIKDYNQRMPSNKQIIFVSSFMASQNGLICIVLMVVLLIVAIFIHILYQAKTLPITLFFGFALIVQLALKRKSDMDYYKKMQL